MVSVAQRLAKLQRRRSKYAEWCQRLALFAIPYMAIAILGHRLGYFDTLSTYWLLGIGLLILVAAVVLGIRGFYDLWSRGEKGGLNSARGTVLAVLLLLPFVYHGFLAYALPPLHDISTDLDDPPVYEFALEDRVEPMNEIEEPSDYQKQLQLRAYPRVVARRYALGAGRLLRAVAELV